MHPKGGLPETKEGFIAGVKDDEYWSDDVWSITTYKRGIPNVKNIFTESSAEMLIVGADRGDGVWIFWA